MTAANPSSNPVTAASDDAAAPPDLRRWKALAVLLLVQFMLILDVSVVNIALPTIQGDLGFSRSGLTWVVDGYVLVAGSLLLLGGRLGDVLGRRRTFLAGVMVFGIASVTCAMAQNPATLVTSRFVQGVGEALAGPAALALIALLFTSTGERARAIGIFGGISGLAGTSGPIVSGLLVEYASWRWIFLINVPIAVAAFITLPRLIGRDAPRTEARLRELDLPGAALATAALTGVVYGLIEAANHPWGSARVLPALLTGIVLLAAFAVYQRFATTPLVPPRFLAERTRVTGNLVTFLFYAVFFSQFFITTLYLQTVLGFSPLRAGLAFLPFGIAVGCAIGIATTIISKAGVRPVLTAGLLLAAGGALLFTRITADGSYTTQVLPASVLFALGSGLCLPALGNAAVHAVTDRDAGLASGLQQALQQVGGAVGLAVLATLALRYATSARNDGLSDAVGATGGYVLALRVGTVVLVVAAVCAAALFPRRSVAAADTSGAPA